MPNTPLMPVVFVGHGNPMNALGDNPYTRAWAQLVKDLPTPKAILMVSAHWYIGDTAVTGMANPRTIHDFGGFPPALFEVQYPAPGSPELAKQVATQLQDLPCRIDDQWGLDHGTWSVLCHLFPQADIPIIQLSIDRTQPPSFHYELGQKLADLRTEGILLMGSGNIVHNLRAYDWNQPESEPYEWAATWDQFVKDKLNTHDLQPLIHYTNQGQDAMLSIPTPDHYLPLLTMLGATSDQDPIQYPVEGFDGRSMSMRAIRFG